MLSLTVWFGFLACIVLASAGVLAVGARRLGSARGRFRVGLLAAILAWAVGAGTGSVLMWALAGAGPLVSISAGAVLQLIATLVTLQLVFRLSAGRAAVLLAVYLFILVGSVGVIVTILRPYVSESFRMPSGGMSPTLQPGDRFSVNKLARPRRWDLALYLNPAPPVVRLCKRVVGLPGERLRFEGGRVFVNDQVVEPPAVMAGRYRASPPFDVPPRYAEGQTIQLGPDEYFLVGDNVDNSFDSRFTGPVRESNVLGVADLLYWPVRRVAIFR